MLRLSYVSFFRNALRQNFCDIVEREFLFMVIQQVDEVFSNVSANLRAWLNIFVLGTKGLCAE